MYVEIEGVYEIQIQLEKAFSLLELLTDYFDETNEEKRRITQHLRHSTYGNALNAVTDIVFEQRQNAQKLHDNLHDRRGKIADLNNQIKELI